MINSSYPASLGKVVRSKGRGLNISAYARAIRAGVAARLSVSRSTPSAIRNAVAACSAATRSAPLDGLTTCNAGRGEARGGTVLLKRSVDKAAVVTMPIPSRPQEAGRGRPAPAGDKIGAKLRPQADQDSGYDLDQAHHKHQLMCGAWHQLVNSGREVALP